MYKTLRKESLKRVLPRILVCAVAAVLLLAICGVSLIHLIAGPKSLETVDTSDMKGEYVSFDASEVIVAFANLTANTDSESKTLKTYYLLPVGDGQYIAVMDEKERNSNVLDRAMEQSREYYLEDLETLTRLGSIQGTVEPLDDDMVDYMTDCIDNYELPGYEEGKDSANLILPWQVNLDYLGFLNRFWVVALAIVAAVFVLLLVVQLAVLYTGCYQRKLRETVGDDVSDEAFSQAVQVERTRVGDYIFYTKGPGSRAVKTSEIIWGYPMPEPMVVSKYRWPVALYTVEQTLIQINFMEQKNCEKFLDAIAAQGNPFIKGYSSGHAEKFQSDFAAFQRDAAAEAAARTE